MVDGLALCSCACVTCLWCSLLAICFPKFLQKLQESDSNVSFGVNSVTRKNSSRLIGVCNPPVNKLLKVSKKSPTKITAACKSRDPRFTVKIVRKSKPRQCILKNSATGSTCEELYGELSSLKRDIRGYHPSGCENPSESGIQTESFDQRERTDFTKFDAQCSSDDLDGNRRCKVDERIVSPRRSNSYASLEDTTNQKPTHGIDHCRGYRRVKKKSKRKSSPLFSARYRPNNVPQLINECGNDRCRRFVYGDLYP